MGSVLFYAAGVTIGVYFLLTHGTGCVAPENTVNDVEENGVPTEPTNPESALIEYDLFTQHGSYFVGSDLEFVSEPIPLSVTEGIPQLGIHVFTDSTQIEVDGQSIPECLPGLINTSQISEQERSNIDLWCAPQPEPEECQASFYCTQEEYSNFNLALCPNGNQIPLLLNRITIERLQPDPQAGYVLSEEEDNTIDIPLEWADPPVTIGAYCAPGYPSLEDYVDQVLVNIPQAWYDGEDARIRVRITPAFDGLAAVDSLENYVAVPRLYVRTVPEVTEVEGPN